MDARPARIYVAGMLAAPDALTAALDEAQERHPDATLVYVRDQPAGVAAAELWAGRGLAFEPLETQAGPGFITDAEIIGGCELVIACVGGTRAEGRTAAWMAREGGVPVVEVR